MISFQNKMRPKTPPPLAGRDKERGASTKGCQHGSGAIIALMLALTAFPVNAETAPDLLYLGGGFYDFDKHGPHTQAADFRMEYRDGISLLPLLADSFNSVEPFMQVHPTLGIEATARGAFFGGGGLALDIPFCHYGILTWNEDVGGFVSGNERPIGSIVEFRSQLELGARFDNGMRLTSYVSHISNAHIVARNPGSEIIGGYLAIPLTESQ